MSGCDNWKSWYDLCRDGPRCALSCFEISHLKGDGLNRGPKDRGPGTGDRGPGTEDQGPGTEDQGPIVLIHQSSCVHAFF